MEPGERKNLIQPADWWRAFEAAASARGESLAEWLGNAGRRALPAEIRRGLSDRRGRGKPKNPEKTAISENIQKSV